MGKLRACFAVAVLAMAASCGEDHAKADAAIIIVDASPDAKQFFDAPPPMYDFTCMGGTAPTTATDPITIGGTTQTVGQGGSMAVPEAAVSVFKTGNNTAVSNVMSDTSGAFMTGNIATGGVPLDGYIRAIKDTYRSTYLYPPTVVAASITGVPVIMISNANFDLVENFASVTQDDTMNGALTVAVTDCALDPIDGATLKVQQGGADVGTVFDLGALLPQAAGTFFVFNVPDGETQLLVSYDNMNFPTRTVRAYKQPTGPSPAGTITATAVRPGP